MSSNVTHQSGDGRRMTRGSPEDLHDLKKSQSRGWLGGFPEGLQDRRSELLGPLINAEDSVVSTKSDTLYKLCRKRLRSAKTRTELSSHGNTQDGSLNTSGIASPRSAALLTAASDTNGRDSSCSTEMCCPSCEEWAAGEPPRHGLYSKPSSPRRSQCPSPPSCSEPSPTWHPWSELRSSHADSPIRKAESEVKQPNRPSVSYDQILGCQNKCPPLEQEMARPTSYPQPLHQPINWMDMGMQDHLNDDDTMFMMDLPTMSHRSHDSSSAAPNFCPMSQYIGSTSIRHSSLAPKENQLAFLEEPPVTDSDEEAADFMGPKDEPKPSPPHYTYQDTPGSSVKELFKVSFSEDQSNIPTGTSTPLHPEKVLEQHFSTKPQISRAESSEFKLPSPSRSESTQSTSLSSSEDLSGTELDSEETDTQVPDSDLRTSVLSSLLDLGQWTVSSKKAEKIVKSQRSKLRAISVNNWTVPMNHLSDSMIPRSQSETAVTSKRSVAMSAKSIQNLSETLIRMIIAMKEKEQARDNLSTSDVGCGSAPILLSRACSAMKLPDVSHASTETICFSTDGAMLTEKLELEDTGVGDSYALSLDMGTQTDWPDPPSIISPPPIKIRADEDLVARRALRLKRRNKASRDRSRTKSRARDPFSEGIWYPISMLTVAIVLPLIGFAMRRVQH